MGLERYKGAAGEAFGIGTTAAMADSVDTKTGESNLVHGMGESSSPSKKIMEEIKSAGNVILVIDEVHTLIGAGAAEGDVTRADLRGATRGGQRALIHGSWS